MQTIGSEGDATSITYLLTCELDEVFSAGCLAPQLLDGQLTNYPGPRAGTWLG
jgi:hypothetical protein